MKLMHVLIAASIFAVTLWLIPFDQFFPAVSALAHGIAEALAIAVFLALTVDKFVKEDLAKEIVKDVSPYIAAASLPKGLREEVHNISTINTYRESVDLEFIIEKQLGSENVQVTTTSIFIMQNLLNEAAPFNLDVVVEKKYSVRNQKHILLVKGENVCLKSDKSPVAFIEEAGDGDLGYDGALGSTRKYTKHLFIPPNGKSTFTTRIVQMFPAEHADVFVSIYATKRAKITLECPTELDVDVLFAHRQSESARISEGFAKQGWRKKMWDFDCAMIPYQPIIYRWWKVV